MNTLRRLLVILPTVAAVSCGSIGPDEAALEREIRDHRAAWVRSRPSSYVYEVERSCFCAEDGRGPVTVQVAGTTVTRTYTSDGRTVTASLADLFPTVDGLFEFLLDALDRGAAQVNVTWDPQGDLPLEMWVDYDEGIADEEVGFRVAMLPTPLPD